MVLKEQLSAYFLAKGNTHLAEITANSTFPNRKVESWKYTSIDLLKIETEKTESPSVPFEHILLNSNLSMEGLTIQQSPVEIPSNDVFDTIASNQCQSVTTYSFNKKFKQSLPLVLVHQETGVQTELIKIVLEEGAHVDIVELYSGHRSFFMTYSMIHVSKNALLQHYQFQFDGMQVGMPQLLAKTYVQQEEKSSYRHFVLSWDGNWTRNELNIHHLGEFLNTEMFGLYYADGKRLIDNHTNLEHAQPNGESSEFYKGIATDQGQAIFNGRIHVFQDAQKTNAFQSNQNLLLSNEAQINAKPQLEIYADDVKCSHGATVGKLRQDEIFYLQSRGISKEIATQILTTAFGAEVIEKIGNETLRNYCLDSWNKKMGV